MYLSNRLNAWRCDNPIVHPYRIIYECRPGAPCGPGCSAERDRCIPAEGSPETLPGGDESGEEQPKRGAARKAIKALQVIGNSFPTLAGEVVKEAGGGPKTAKAAMVLATVGDLTIPGVPVASAVIIVAATIKNPAAPFRVGKRLVGSAIEKVKARRGKVSASARTYGSAQQPDRGRSLRVGRLIQSVANEDWAIQVIAQALEEAEGDFDLAMETAEEVLKDNPEPVEE